MGGEKALTSDVELLQEYLRLGIRDILSVPCSITDTWQWLAAQASLAGSLRLTMSNHEGNLPGMAAGVFFGTGQPALVHMQNSGLFNAGDGFLTLVSPAIYQIPVAVIVTYRGSYPDDSSEPHQEIGRRTDELTAAIFGDSSSVFGSYSGGCLLDQVRASLSVAQAGGVGVLKLSPAVFRKTITAQLAPSFATLTIEPLEALRASKGDLSLPASLGFTGAVHRDQAIAAIVAAHPKAAILFCNGYTSRAAQSVADRWGNFYNLGYMGGTLAIGWALAHSRPDLEVVVVDGDQNAQMSSMKDHLLASYPVNLYWYVLNNHVGASVGTAESIPLAPIYRSLARVIETISDPPDSFPHPRVCARGANIVDDPPAGEKHNLASLARGFRAWVQQTSQGVKDESHGSFGQKA